jgi:hypothetical protein
MKRIGTICCIVVVLFFNMHSKAQDSSVVLEKKIVTLKEVVVRSDLNVPLFIKRVQEDTSFYKAFKNLRVLGYTALNDIRMFDKKRRQKASLWSRTRQTVEKGCRWMEVQEEQSTGDMFDRSHSFNYYTAEMYAGLFFAKDTICGENNIVAGTDFSFRNKKGIDKHKEQLKMLFFNPGKRIPGIPFIGDKIALFDEEASALYDFVIDMNEFKGEMCYVFTITPRQDLSGSQKDRIVINEMKTWFSTGNWEILGRNYSLSYKAGVYDFDVRMEIELTRFGEYLVPSLLRYDGNWDLIFKKRETAVFTATLFDFREQ